MREIRHERRRIDAAKQGDGEIFIISPANIETVLAAAEAGDEGARGALFYGEIFVENEQQHCLHCHDKFTFDNRPYVLVVVNLHNSDNVKTAGFCIECVEDGSFIPHLEKLGIKREELFARKETLQ